MGNFGGSVEFEFDVKLDKLNQRVRQVEGQLNHMNNNLQNEGTKIGNVYSKVGGMIAGYFSVQAVAGFAGAIIRTRSEFEKFQAVLTTAYGSQEKANQAMNMLRQTATETP